MALESSDFTDDDRRQDVFEITMPEGEADELDLQELLGPAQLPPLVTAPSSGAPRAWMDRADPYEEIDLGSLA